MERTQWYIGTVNGAVVCVDRISEHRMQGRLYHGYSQEGAEFHSVDDVIFQLERFFDSLNFPHPTTTKRSFQDKKQATIAVNQRQERERVMMDGTLLSKHGDLGTFIVRVQHRQNSSWQGRLTWMEENKTVCFRSVWEMVKLMESALDTVSQPEDDEGGEPSWFQEKT